MRALVLWPPHVPSYFNAGHHIATFLTSSYLRSLPGVDHVAAIDAGALNYSWKELSDVIYQARPDIVVTVNDFDNFDDLPRVTRYVRQLAPRARIVTGGRLSSQAPRIFRGFDLDGVVTSGDLEAGTEAFIRFISGERSDHSGVSMRIGDRWEDGGPGRFLDPEEWRLPDPAEIPYAAYERLYARDQNKFCGIPERRELVVPAVRGCPIGCEFCEVPSFQGRRERRLSVERTVKYIEDCFNRWPFEYVAFYAPTFTLDRRWIADLCGRLQQYPTRFPWKCATTLFHLDDELIQTMAAAGCVRISVGLETLEAVAQRGLPRPKHIQLERFRHVAELCRSNGVELNCFIIVGLPGTTVEGVARTIEEVRSAGARVRPTMYSSMDALRAAQHVEEAQRFNRQLIPPDGEMDADERDALYGFLFGAEDWATRIMERVPVRAGR